MLRLFVLAPHAGVGRRIRTGLEGLATLFDEVRVRENDDGTLAIGFGRWTRVAPDAFQWHEGFDAYRAFRLDENAGATHLFINAGAYRRLSWYESAGFTTWTAMVLLAVGLVAVVAAPVARRRRAVPGSASQSKDGPAFRVWRALTLSASGVLLTFAVSFGVAFGLVDPQRLFKGIPTTVSATLVLPLLDVALVLAAVIAGSLARHKID